MTRCSGTSRPRRQQPGATVHDLWLARPGDDPEEERFEVAPGGIAFPGAPARSYTVDEAGMWTYLCTIHATMRGTIDAAEGGGGGEPGSGVAFTEYRLNAGEWVRSDNDAAADPFETMFTVEDAGDYLVEYRSTDEAGNVEATKSVEFSIAEDEPTDPDAPTASAFADPSEGAAPLLVQFSATGLDPQGGRLEYEWDFGTGDGSGSFDQYPTYTYQEPGTYTATVTVTDPQGKTGTDTVEIVVTEDGNVAPVVQAQATPRSGQAPLQVAFSARATDADGSAGDITYLWDFDDAGANAFGATASHTYMEPGTYTATVTATDGEGAFDTAEVTIVVADPPGNVAPNVTAAATPRSGAAPLQVRFTSRGTDPDGDQVQTVWNFGDGQQAGGESATHTYRTAGTYTATVTVTDPGGATDTASVTITVTGTTGSTTLPPASVPPSFAPPPSSGDVADEPSSRARIRAPKTADVRDVIRRGLRLRVSCEDACRAKSVLRLSGRRVGVSKQVRVKAGRSRTLVVRLTGNVRRNLMAAMRQARLKRVTTTAITTVRTADLSRAYPARIRLIR